MMNEKEKIIKIPKGISYISDWDEFESNLPKSNKLIIDKELTGCGCTYWALDNIHPTILVSPRKQLLESKMKSEHFLGKLFYFKRDKETKLGGLKNKLRNYLLNSSIYGGKLTPKILVCFDSFFNVLEVIRTLNIEDKFEIFADEFHCCITDSHLKRTVGISLVRYLSKIDNKVYFCSATPLTSLYLENVPEFSNFTVCKLKFSEDVVRRITVKQEKITTTIVKVICDLIQRFRTQNYFESKVVNGKIYYSKAGIFFINSISVILKVAQQMGLSNKDTKIICGVNDTNLFRLQKIGLEPSTFNSEEEIDNNPPFTFCTRASFDGSDLFSKSCSSYIFSNPSSDCLAIDIGNDIRQVIGRCRTRTNVFRDEITLFYKPCDKNIEQLENDIQERIRVSNKCLENNEYITDEQLDSLTASQQVRNYSRHYLEASKDENGKGVAVINTLALCDDLHSLEIYKNQFQNEYKVLTSIKENEFELRNLKSDRVQEVLENILKDKFFERRMKFCCETLENNPKEYTELLKSRFVPESFNNYIQQLGTTKIKSLKYREKDILREIANNKQEELVSNRIKDFFKIGTKLERKQIKNIIQGIYDELDIKRKATGSDLQKYIPYCIEIKMGKVRGFEVVSKEDFNKKHKHI